MSKLEGAEKQTEFPISIFTLQFSCVFLDFSTLCRGRHINAVAVFSLCSFRVYFSTLARFVVVDTPMPWQDARDRCRSLGRELARVDDAEKRLSLNSFLVERGYDGNLWIGLNDLSSEVRSVSMQFMLAGTACRHHVVPKLNRFSGRQVRWCTYHI